MPAPAGRPRFIPTLIPCGVIRLGQHALAELRQQRHLVQLVALEQRELRDVAMRHHHQVAGVVGKHVEDDVGQLAFVDDQLPPVADGPGDAEDAAGRIFRSGHVRVPPW